MRPVEAVAACGRRARTLSGVEAARGIAAVLVLLYHVARHLAAALDRPALAWPFQAGHAGVDFFFVLSGFIILFVHGNDIGRPAALPRYLAQRGTRVLPAYWVALAATIALGAAASHPVPPVGRIAWDALLLPASRDTILGVAWTLRFEALFYALFALLLLNRRAGLAAISAWLLSSLVAALLGRFPAWLPAPFHGAENLQFVLGMAAAWVVRRCFIPCPRLVLASGVALFAAAAALETARMLDGYGVAARLLYGTPAALIVVGLVAAERTGRLQVPRGLRALGRASYSIYLFQFVFIGLAWRMVQAGRLDRHLPAPAMVLLLLLAAGAGGMIVSATIEHPLTRLLRAGRTRPARASPGSAACCRLPRWLPLRF